MNYVTSCRHFNGYKPCGLSENCSSECIHKDIPRLNILLIHLGAIGAVVRSTSLLESIHKKYPGCRLIWVTDAPSHNLLKNHPLIDHVYSSNESDLLELSSWSFEIALCVDKSRKAAGILKRVEVDHVFGFIIDNITGAAKPATTAAYELWEIGLNDQKKFFENPKPETQLIHESLDLGPWRQSKYCLPLSKHEKDLAFDRRNEWIQNSSQAVIGLNTGCSTTIPAKKFTVEYHRNLIQDLIKAGYENIILLGGPEDTKRNFEIARGLGVMNSPSDKGLRDGLVSVEACDIVITGDSLGMHLAIARNKFVVAWFGPTCEQEIDLYGRGVKLMANVSCSPCWKRSCTQPIMCYDRVEIVNIIEAIKSYRPASETQVYGVTHIE